MKDLFDAFFIGAAVFFGLNIFGKLAEKARVKAKEIHAKTLAATDDKDLTSDAALMVRISLLVCEIEMQHELQVLDISNKCKIRYTKPDPAIFYEMVSKEIREFAA